VEAKEKGRNLKKVKRKETAFVQKQANTQGDQGSKMSQSTDLKLLFHFSQTQISLPRLYLQQRVL